MVKRQSEEPEMMTVDDVAEFLQVSTRSVHNWVKEGKLPQPVFLGRLPRWRRGELLKHLDEMAPTNQS